MLRHRLVQAGIYDPRGAAYFFLARVVLAVGLAVATFFVLPMFGSRRQSLVLAVRAARRRRSAIWRRASISTAASRRGAWSISAGFPDFMDLLVVCADAGLAMEAALDRVGRELGDSYPSLAANIHMANLEIRAGRTMSEALEHLGDRLGLEEARSFATLIQQSDELGSSDQRRVARLQRRHAPQAPVARRGEGLQLAGQARGADDGVHLPGAVHRHSAAGHRQDGHGQLVSALNMGDRYVRTLCDRSRIRADRPA